jgi:hypothetical protein
VLDASAADATDAGSHDSADGTADAPESQPPPHYPFHDALPTPALAASAPAMRYANLSPAQCRKELAGRKLPVKRKGGATPGVATAFRITGPIAGVRVVAPGRSSPYGIADCRLVLVLSDWLPTLAESDVTMLWVDNMYRPRARLRRGKRSQHHYGLAIDIVGFTLADGRKLLVEEDWNAGPGSRSCGPDAVLDEPDDDSVSLRNLVCAAARGGFFHHMLTPGYNAAHRDHLHFDVKRGAKRRIVR